VPWVRSTSRRTGTTGHEAIETKAEGCMKVVKIDPRIWRMPRH
jgi:hypothetical protein